MGFKRTSDGRIFFQNIEQDFARFEEGVQRQSEQQKSTQLAHKSGVDLGGAPENDSQSGSDAMQGASSPSVSSSKISANDGVPNKPARQKSALTTRAETIKSSDDRLLQRPSSKPVESAVEVLRASKAESPKAAQKDASQIQILTLLKSLNLKLQNTEKDRDALKKDVSDTKIEMSKMQKLAKAHEERAKTVEAELKRQLYKMQAEPKTAENSEKVEKAENMVRGALKEIEQTRQVISEIKSRSIATERSVKKQSMTLQSAEQKILKQQQRFEQDQQSKSQSIEKRLLQTQEQQDIYNKKLAELGSKNEKLDRKIEQAIQGRSRFLRKLERIEETVMQTNEAMNARAMVLLTDQNAAAQSGYPQMSAAQGAPTPNVQIGSELLDEANLYKPWWQKKIRLDATSAITIVLVVLALGWGANEIQRPNDYDLNFSELYAQAFSSENALSAAGQSRRGAYNDGQGQNQNQWAQDDATVSNASQNQYTDHNNAASYGQENSVYTNDFASSEESANEPQSLAGNQAARTGETQSVYVGPEFSESGAEQYNDIDAVHLGTHEEVLQALEQGQNIEPTNEVAAMLNQIEPSSAPAQTEGLLSDDGVMKQKQDMQEYVGASSSGQPEVFVMPAKPTLSLEKRIQKDSSLPENIKRIEAEAFAGDPEAQHDLAAIYTAGHGGVEQNYKKAGQWFEEAAHNGIANARYNLGVMYHQGIGTEKKLEKAFQWYNAAAELGHPEAQYNLGIAYIEGLGVQYNPLVASQYFENAANSGVVEASYNLGLLYENGLLGKAEPDQALMWYKHAADQGSPEAKAALEQLAKTIGIELDAVNSLVEKMKHSNATRAETLESKLAVPSKTASQKAVSDLSPNERQSILISQIQKKLMEQGLYPGPADGVSGMLTKDAIEAYQGRNDLNIDGEISEELLSHMVAQNEASVSGASLQFVQDGTLDQGSREE